MGDLERSWAEGYRARRSLRMWLLFATTTGPLTEFSVRLQRTTSLFARASLPFHSCDGRPTGEHARSSDLYLCECASALQSSCALQNFLSM